MSRRFTDAYVRRWSVNTHRADDGRLEFTAYPPRRVLRHMLRFLIRGLVVAALFFIAPFVLVDGQEPMSALAYSLLIGVLVSGLLTGISAVLRLRVPSDPLVLAAPFPLRADLSEEELSRAVEAAKQMHLRPDHTGPIDVRAIVARSLRDEKPASRLAR